MIFHKILLVEDDKPLGLALKDFFEENDFKVIYVLSGEEAVDVYEKENPSLVLLDVKLPGMDGFEVIEKIRNIDNQTPVIMMTGTEYDQANQVKGYNLRAIYYLQKPVDPEVLLAQINMLLDPPETMKYRMGGYTIIIQNREIMINDDLYTLPQKDVLVLSLLLRKKNDTVSRKELLLSVWNNDKISNNNLLDSSISSIRRILKNYPGIEIKSVYGEGYVLSL